VLDRDRSIAVAVALRYSAAARSRAHERISTAERPLDLVRRAAQARTTEPT